MNKRTAIIIAVSVAIVLYEVKQQVESRDLRKEVERLEHALAESALPAIGGAAPSATGASEGIAPEAAAAVEMAESGILDTLNAGNIDTVLQQLSSEPNPVRKNYLLARLSTLLTKENAVDLIAAARKVGLPSTASLMTAWGQIDGREATAYAMSEAGGLLINAIEGWASSNPQGALAFARTIDNKDRRFAALTGVVEAVARVSSDRAINIALELAEAREFPHYQTGRMIHDIMEQRQSEGSVEADIEWASSLSDDHDVRENAVASIAISKARHDSASAAELISPHAGEPYAEEAIYGIAAIWARKDDGHTVANWLSSLPAEADHTKAWHELGRFWSDPHAAADYFIAMPEGPNRDRALSTLAGRHSTEDPFTAMSWANNIGDEKWRFRQVSVAGREWMRREPKKALEWLKESNLPEEWVKKIANPPEDWR